MNQYNIEELAADLFPGETLRSICPGCQATHEKSLAITRTADGSLAYICHRASCNLRGFIGGLGGTRYLGTGSGKKTSHKPFKEVLDPLPGAVKDMLYSEYGIEPWTLSLYNVQWCAAQGAIAIPILSFGGHQVGITLKTYTQEGKTVRTYKTEDSELMGWYGPSNLQYLTIVEDQLSAMKIAQEGHRAVALCGTHFNATRALLIARHAELVNFWLDFDAANKAIEYLTEYGVVFKYGGIVSITGDDPKDCESPLLKYKLANLEATYNERKEHLSSRNGKPGDMGKVTPISEGVSSGVVHSSNLEGS